MNPAHTLSATQALSHMAAGRLSSEALVQACLQQIARHEPQVHAWQHLDAEGALQAARASDALRRQGGPVGKLHGLPVAIKDNIDTASMPTTYGSPIYAAHRPARDATVVAQLLAEGAIILGKTVSTEFAYFTPGPTHNPHRAGHTPGGSSSGSAAAVAAGMVPLALGTQTNGSVIRPAAFCGVLGYKPAGGLIAREGVLDTSRTLDQVGCFARTVDDVEWLAQCLAPSLPMGRPLLPSALKVGVLHSPLLERAAPAIRTLLQRTTERLAQAGVGVQTVALEHLHAHANQLQRTLMQCEMAQALAPERERSDTQLSAALLALMDAGMATGAVAYIDALRARPALAAQLEQRMGGCDVLLMPSTLGAAPEGLASTGDPVFCSMASLLGWPALHLPLEQDAAAHGLPIGLQLVARPHQEAALGACARLLLSLSGQSEGVAIAAAVMA